MTARERGTPPPSKGGAPEIKSLNGDKNGCNTLNHQVKVYPAPDWTPDYGAGINCLLACSPSCPYSCPMVWGQA